MTTIGTALGTIGAVNGGIGIRTTTYFLNPLWLWMSLITLGLGLIFRFRKRNNKYLKNK
jgi:hypothetical protein